MKTQKNRFFLLLVIFIFVLQIFCNNVCFGATYDLSDYKNHDLKGGRWCIVYSEKDDKIYLITIKSDWYPYLVFDIKQETSGEYSINGNVIADAYPNYNYNALGNLYFYTFNPETSKFENLVEHQYIYTLGEGKVIASGCELYGMDGTNFFHQTPVPFQVLIKPTLAEMVTKALAEMIQGIIINLRTIIVIGLSVLSIGLLIYVIKSVIWRAT